ncbi:hypothetical protein Hte_006760 [Hypoxylon texense]
MAYTDDAVLSKLSALSETSDSIVSVGQWIMFHRRHADRTVQLWLQRLKDSPSHKRLNLIYLANEVAQQTKARRREDFVVAFSPIMAEAVATAYKGASLDIQQRIQRVVDVWRDRNVFEEPILEAMYARIQEINQARGTAKTGLSGSIFGSSASIPAELAPLTAPQQNVTKLLLGMKSTVNAANQEYDKLLGPDSTAPSAPVYAARLSGLLKSLAQAEGAVDQCVKARRELVAALQKALDTNRNALISEEDQLETFVRRRMEVEDKKTEVERAIMAGLPADDEPYIPSNGFNDQPVPEPDRPEVEALTPPPTEQDVPEQRASLSNTEQPSSAGLAQEATLQPTTEDIATNPGLAAAYKSVVTAVNGSKKRKLDDSNDFPDLGEDDGIDSDVAEILRRDSGS